MDCEQIVDAVRNWLDKDDWKYEYDADKNVIRSGINLKSKLKNCKIIIIFNDDSYLVILSAPVNGDTDNLDELMKYLTMVNFGLSNGNFELDVRDGEIRYKVFVNCNGLESLPEEIIQDSIYVGCFMMEKFGDGIAALALGFSDAATEIEKAEQQREESDD
ncbi:MAG: hypothetical protein IJS14_06560 [Lentisphaeria bacterium]|nr:hypothetical protein [Lentisphaeria bacterium]